MPQTKPWTMREGFAVSAGNEDVQSSMFNVQSDNWHSIDGRKLSGEPSTKGVCINNGKKIVIK